MARINIGNQLLDPVGLAGGELVEFFGVDEVFFGHFYLGLLLKRGGGGYFGQQNTIYGFRYFLQKRFYDYCIRPGEVIYCRGATVL